MTIALRIFGLAPSLFLSALALALLRVVLASASSAQTIHLNSLSTLDRDLEPVVVTGLFAGAPVGEVFVYREISAAWEQIPFQVDEVTASGSYTTTEDGLMDANDEVVFMAGDLGGAATAPITATLPISGIWYAVNVTDPLSPTKTGWAYVVRSAALTPTSSVDYAEYITASQRISATNYEIGWAVNHSGQDYLSLFGGGDILDRTKLRIKPTIGLTITENNPPTPPLILIKDGALRVIVRRGTATTFGYRSFLNTLTLVDLTSFSVTSFRISTDLTNTITNGAYYNENVPSGVPIDGIPDPVPSTPFVKAWRQVSLDSGSVVQVVNLAGVGGTLGHYYKDDSALAIDTGDARSFGDSGIMITNPTASMSFTVESAQYILPGRQPNRGDEFYQLFQNPLVVTIQAEGAHKVYLPLIRR